MGRSQMASSGWAADIALLRCSDDGEHHRGRAGRAKCSIRASEIGDVKSFLLGVHPAMRSKFRCGRRTPPSCALMCPALSGLRSAGARMLRRR